MNINRKIHLASAAAVASGALALVGLGHPRIAAAACQPGAPHRLSPRRTYGGYFGHTRLMRQAECERRTARSRVPSGTWYGRSRNRG
jgi:hypothetical protein